MESSENIDTTKKNTYGARILNYSRPLVLPLVLTFIFSLQNIFFNQWLGLKNLYLGRLSLVTFGLGLILYGPSLLFKRTGKYIYLSVMSFFVSSLFVSQFLYFKYAQSFLQFSVIKYIGQGTSVLGTVVTLVSWQLLLFVLNMIVIAGALIIISKKQLPEIIISNKGKAIILLLVLLIGFGGYYFLIRQEDAQWGDASRLYKDVYDLNTLVEKIGIVNFSFEDAFKYAARSNLVSDQDEDFLSSYAKAYTVVQYSPKNDPYFGDAKGKNIIFIQIESLENCVLNYTFNGQEITPNLDALAQQGMYFSNYYTQVGPGNTADAEFTTLDSLYPLQDDVVFVDYAQNNYNALPQLLVKNGYHTYALHGDVPTFWNRSSIYPNLGYQTQISEDQYVKSHGSIGKGPSDLGDEDFFLQSLAKMQTFKAPFMATLITISSHTPFELPQDLQTLQIPDNTNLDYTQQQYLESIHYMDKSLGEFMDGLKKTSLYDNSIIYIFGDHGSYTNIADALGVGDPDFPALRHSQVPLIIIDPSKGLTGQMSTPASHLDLYPTVADLAGITPPKDILGQDMLATKTPLVVNRNLFSGSINTILTSNMLFLANIDGVFADGTCYSMPGKTVLPVDDCKTIYDQQSDTVKASDIIIRGNLLSLFAKNIK